MRGAASVAHPGEGLKVTADRTMLRFDWEEVLGSTVEAVTAAAARATHDGNLICDEIAIIVAGRAVVLRVDDETDEVIVSLESSDGFGAWPPLAQFREMVGQPLGWCWAGRNYLGYLDTFLLAVDGIDPNYVFTGMASSLNCGRIAVMKQ